VRRSQLSPTSRTSTWQQRNDLLRRSVDAGGGIPHHDLAQLRVLWTTRDTLRADRLGSDASAYDSRWRFPHAKVASSVRVACPVRTSARSECGVSGRACFRRLPAASALQASGFRSNVTVFRQNATAVSQSGLEPAFRRNMAARVYPTEAAHNPEVAGSNPAPPRSCDARLSGADALRRPATRLF
jgi:hypothetical protein